MKIILHIFLLAISSLIAPGEEKPNIVFILADDLGIGDVKCCHEPSRIKTPHIDKLAEQAGRAYRAGQSIEKRRAVL